MSDGKVVIDAELNTAEFEDGLKQLDVLTVAAGNVLAGVFESCISKVSEFAAGAVQVGMSYDTAMSQVAATMGKTVDQIIGLSDAAQEMGATTKFTATEAAESINILAMAGLNESAILAENAKGATILSTTLDLASAGAMDMAAAATYLTGAVKGFGDEASNAQYYADLMAKGATLANTDVSGLGAALSDAAATASAYGQTADSVTLSLLRLAEQNVTGSAASTNLAAAMKNLYTPTDQAKKALEKLGVSAYNADGSARDFNDVVDDLTASLSGYTAEEANAYKQTIFGIQGLDAYNKMAITTGDKLEEFKTGLAGASEEFGGMGAAAGQAQTQLDNLEGDMTLLSSATDGLSLALYNTFSGTLRDVVSFGTSAISQLTEALETGGVSGMLSAAADIGMSLIQGFVQQIPGLLQTGVDMAVSLIEGLASGAAANVSSFIDTALPMLMEFSGQLRANAGQLVDAGLELILQIAQGIADGIPTMIQTIPTIVTNIASIINDNAPKLLATGVKILGTLGHGLINAIPVLMENIPKIFEAVVSVLTAMNWVGLGTNIINFIRNGLSAAGQAIPNLLKNIGEKASNFLKNINWASLGRDIIAALQLGIGEMRNILPAMLKAIGTAALNLFKSIDWIGLGANLIAGIIAGINGTLDMAVAAILGLGRAILDGIKNFFGIHSPSTVMAEIGEFLIMGLVNALTGLPGALTGILGDALSALSTWGGNLAKLGLNAAKNTLNNVSSYFKQMPGKVSAQLTNVIGKCKTWAQSMTSKAKTAASQTLNHVGNFIGQMPGRVASHLTSVIGRVTSWASSMTSKAKNAASQTLNSVVSCFSQMPEHIASHLTSVIGRVTSWASSLVSKARTAGSDALSGVVNQISQMPSRIASHLTSVLSRVSSWGSSLASRFRSIGQDAIQGVINGIGSKVSKLYDSIKSSLSGLVDKAKNALGIASPSKVFRDEVGRWIPEGVAVGVEKKSPALYRRMEDMSKELVRHTSLPDLSGFMGRVQDAVAAEAGIVTLRAVATTSSGAGVVPVSEDKTDYKKLSERIVDAFAAAGIAVKVNHRELGRLIAEKG